MSEDTYLRSNIIGAIEDTCHVFVSSTVNVACIDEEVAQGAGIWPPSEDIYILAYT
jgi:hypothetical protein